MSTSLSRFTAALMAGSQENTMALAAINFDFSLYKVEAPKEYLALGSCLSDERRRMAEGGSQHVTARKLGAIFRSMLPKVPNLLRAFGERVSEIAQKSATKTQGSDNTIKEPPRNIFSQKMGIDGTSIWAAATSGTEALCVQLLACILARFWSPEEATSIWAEILEARKLELSAREGDFDFPDIVAMQATVSREQLAEWDASARAWLRTADSINSKQQTQLRLIINNLDLEVNKRSETYTSVMEAWTESMQVVDNLVAGVPQSVYDGASLVGLSAWHLFPNMMVYVGEYKEISQGDPLVKDGGLLTIGLEASPGFEAGVRWSLPLTTLRYYGDPVTVVKRLDIGNSRVSIDQLMMIALGCLAGQWPEMPDKHASLCKYYECLGNKARLYLGKDTSSTWVSYLAKAASKFLEARGEEKAILRRLIELGTRRGRKFLGIPVLHYTKQIRTDPIGWDSQMFGLTRPLNYLSCLSGPEMRVRYLRKVMMDIEAKNDAGSWIIAYPITSKSYAFATAFVAPGLDEHKTYHYTWNIFGSKPMRTISNSSDAREITDEKYLGFSGWKYDFPSPKHLIFTGPTSAVERSTFAAIFEPNLLPTGILWQKTPVAQFEVFFGDVDCAAVYKRIPNRTDKHFPPDSVSADDDFPLGGLRIDYEEIMSAISEDKVDLRRLKNTGTLRPLQCLGTVARLYASLGGASISSDVISSPLVSKNWLNDTRPAVTWFGICELTDANSFSCIVNMETGDQDLEPELLKDVMALSVGDSIFALSTLMSDPYEDANQPTIVRTFGNVGKYGISLIIPPPEPRMRKPKTGDWNVINHDPWDGVLIDSFKSTSLHLFLTGYRVPYTTSHQGSRDIQAFFQEAVVSVYDGNSWFGDITIVRPPTDTSVPLIRVSRHEHATDDEDTGEMDWLGRLPIIAKAHAKEASSQPEILCVDNWYELIDKPEQPLIVRSHKNWLARLAAVSLSRQLGYKTMILPDDGCLKGCFSDIKYMREHVAIADYIIIS